MREADKLPPSCAVVTKSGSLNFMEPSGPVQACNGTALPFYVFGAHVLIISRSKLHYTASGIISLIGGRPVHEAATYRCDDTRGYVIQF